MSRINRKTNGNFILTDAHSRSLNAFSSRSKFNFHANDILSRFNWKNVNSVIDHVQKKRRNISTYSVLSKATRTTLIKSNRWYCLAFRIEILCICYNRNLHEEQLQHASISCSVVKRKTGKNNRLYHSLRGNTTNWSIGSKTNLLSY